MEKVARSYFQQSSVDLNHELLRRRRVKKITTAPLLVSVVFACLIGLGIFSDEAQARVEAFLERNEIYVDETVTLVIESSVPQGPSPDIGALRQQFDVETGSTNSRTKLVNGARFSLTRWTYRLTPKQTGIFTIPAIVVRGEITVPISLKVTDVPEDVRRETATHAKAELEVVNGDHEPYVQQQLILSLRLLYDDTVTSGESTDPVVANAVVEKFRGEQNYTTERDGRQYRVYEQRFVISAESSGELIIPPITFSGTLSTSDRSRPQIESTFEERIRRMLSGTPLENDPFFMEDNFTVDRRNTGRPFKVTSNEIRLNVRPRPTEFGSSPWLPAQDLVIEDSWETNPPQMQVGQPVKRSLILKAKGLVASQIPELDITQPENARMYMEPPFSDTPTDSQSINGQREHVITYIPDKTGELVIPQVRMDWWNVDEDAARVAQIQSVTLDVLPGVGTFHSDNQGVAETASTDSESESASVSQQDPDSSDKQTPLFGADGDNTVENSNNIWFHRLTSIPLILTVLLVIGALLVWLRLIRLSNQSGVEQTASRTGDSLNHRLRSLQLAQTSKDPGAASRALLDLAKLRWPQSPPRNLGSLAHLLHGSKIDAKPLIDLERHLFSDDEKEWNAATVRPYLNPRIWMAEQTRPRKKKSVGLAPLYPRHLTRADGAAGTTHTGSQQALG